MYAEVGALLCDVKFVKKCLYNYLNSNFSQPLNELASELWPGLGSDVSLAHSHKSNTTSSSRFYIVYGYACLLLNKAVLTFDIGDIDVASSFVLQARNSAYYSTASWWKNKSTQFSHYTLIELHAQLLYAECDFLIGLLSILKSVVLLHKPGPKTKGSSLCLDSCHLLNDSMTIIPTVAHFYGAECLYCVSEPGAVNFKSSVSILVSHFARLTTAGLSFMHAHNMFQHLLKIIQSNNINLNSEIEQELFNELKCGVYVVIGAFNLFSAVLPKKCLSLLQVVHSLVPNKSEGIKLIDDACSIPAMRQVIAISCLLSYQLVFLDFVGPCCEMNAESSRNALSKLKRIFPNDDTDFLYHYFQARYLLIHGNEAGDSLECFLQVADRHHLENEYLQVKLICRFEMMWIDAFLCNWQTASENATVLASSTYWSRSYFVYLHYVFKLCHQYSIDASCVQINDVDSKLLNNLNSYFACQPQIKVIPADRLAAVRAPMLVTNPSLCMVFALESVFWHCELRNVERCHVSYEKYEALIENLNCESEQAAISKELSYIKLIIKSAFEVSKPVSKLKFGVLTDCLKCLVVSTTEHCPHLPSEAKLLMNFLKLKVCFRSLPKAKRNNSKVHKDMQSSICELAANEDPVWSDLICFVVNYVLRSNKEKEIEREFIRKNYKDVYLKCLQLLLANVVELKISKNDAFKSEDSQFSGRVHYLLRNLISTIEMVIASYK